MGNAFQPITSALRWAGEDLAGKRLVVCADQGWGDQIMAGRFLPELTVRGVEVIVACHPKLARLFERIGYWTRPATTDRPIPESDYWALFTDLAALVRSNPPAEYLGFPITSGGGVGVVPNGNPVHWNDAQRSLFGDDAAALLKMGRDLRPEATGCYDFSDTADLIADLDLIVTVDSSVAHLAGSMGKRCWVLLPHSGMDRRWGDGVTSRWYPRLKLYRQRSPGDWPSVLNQVARDLATPPPG